MFDTYKLSGKFSLEYLVFLFECLEEHGLSSDFIIVSQNGAQQFKISYDAEKTKLFYISLLNRTLDSRLDSLTETHSLKRVELLAGDDFTQTLSAEVHVNLAQAMIFGSHTLLDPKENFELDSSSAQNVFSQTMFKSQFIYPPFINMFLLFLWVIYEFIKYSFFGGSLSFNFRNFDLVEGFLLIASCYFFWGTKPSEDDIPVFREGTSDSFAMYKSAIHGCLTSMIFLMVLSLFTS